MRGTMLAASTGRGKLAFDLGKAARPVGDNIQLRRLALCPVELRARCSASTLTLVATLRACISCSRMHSCALERASARGRAEEHEARGPLLTLVAMVESSATKQKCVMVGYCTEWTENTRCSFRCNCLILGEVARPGRFGLPAFWFVVEKSGNPKALQVSHLQAPPASKTCLSWSTSWYTISPPKCA